MSRIIPPEESLALFGDAGSAMRVRTDIRSLQNDAIQFLWPSAGLTANAMQTPTGCTISLSNGMNLSYTRPLNHLAAVTLFHTGELRVYFEVGFAIDLTYSCMLNL